MADVRDLATLRRELQQVVPTNASVLPLGETGVGKERFARMLHHVSRRTNERSLTTAFEPPALTTDVKRHAKYACQNGIHVIPTFRIDGLVGTSRNRPCSHEHSLCLDNFSAGKHLTPAATRCSRHRAPPATGFTPHAARADAPTLKTRHTSLRAL
jgi:hypothetical protein